jgi:hypothetical protein
MRASGHGLKSIAVVLRHRLVDTTVIDVKFGARVEHVEYYRRHKGHSGPRGHP